MEPGGCVLEPRGIESVAMRSTSTHQLMADSGPGDGSGSVAVEASGPIPVIQIRGLMTQDPVTGLLNRAMKGSTVGTWAELRAAAKLADKAAGGKGGFVLFDGNGPGGSVFGADTARAAVSDMEATTLWWNSGSTNSALMLLASAADHVAGSPLSEFGSMSVRMDVADRTEADKREGVKRISITPKGDVFKSSEMTEELVAHLTDRAEETKALFGDMVAEGRSLDAKALAPLMTGKTFSAADAVLHGLSDGVFPDRDAFVASILNPDKDKEAPMADNETPAEVKLAEPAAVAPEPIPAIETTAAVAAASTPDPMERMLSAMQDNTAAMEALTGQNAVMASKLDGALAEIASLKASAAASVVDKDAEALASMSMSDERRAVFAASVKAQRAGGDDAGADALLASVKAQQTPAAVDALSFDLMGAGAGSAKDDATTQAQAYAADNPDVPNAYMVKLQELLAGEPDDSVFIVDGDA